jgi:hypothetical protein
MNKYSVLFISAGLFIHKNHLVNSYFMTKSAQLSLLTGKVHWTKHQSMNGIWRSLLIRTLEYIFLDDMECLLKYYLNCFHMVWFENIRPQTVLLHWYLHECRNHSGHQILKWILWWPHYTYVLETPICMKKIQLNLPGSLTDKQVNFLYLKPAICFYLKFCWAQQLYNSNPLCVIHCSRHTPIQQNHTSKQFHFSLR